MKQKIGAEAYQRAFVPVLLFHVLFDIIQKSQMQKV